MSILKGIIKDLKDDETHIAGCTTPDEIIIALESADSRLDNAIEYNKYTTNGELFEKAHNPFEVIRHEKTHTVHVYLTKKKKSSWEPITTSSLQQNGMTLHIERIRMTIHLQKHTKDYSTTLSKLISENVMK